MTRLTENDIAGIEAEWATYERRLEELTGDDLLTLAAFRLMCPVFSSPRAADLICSSGPMTIRISLRTSLLVPWAKTVGPRGAGSPPP